MVDFERCQNEFVTESINLRRRGNCGERESFPRHPKSVRLIKSHGWRGSEETEPEHVKEARCDSKEILK